MEKVDGSRSHKGARQPSYLQGAKIASVEYSDTVAAMVLPVATR
jgi:hypothetical protein